jgi:asparagine synthase (glutamine-hydrolysing)
MCGINGIFAGNKLNDKIVNEQLLLMNELIIHRGPDASGVYFSNGHGIGHTRLSIIDLAEISNQPMLLDNDYIISYNGEIYNYLELKAELIQLGCVFKTNSDTEVILNAYKLWGNECLNRFNGMWAFIIIDKIKNIAFMSRDRFGVKPLYYSVTNGIMRISSELKPILKFKNEVIANKRALANYLVLDICDESDETFFMDIFRLLPSHFLTLNLSTNEFNIKRYYEIKNENVTDNYKSEEAFEVLLNSSIELRLRSDVRVGTCLSGGLDSSLIAGIASKKSKEMSQKKFLAFTAQSTETKNDEFHFAKDVVEHCDLEWLVSKPDVDEFKGRIDEVILCQEEPFRSPSVFLQYGIMKSASEMKCKVLLDGQGGDETFLGYERYYISFLKNVNPLKWSSEIKNIIQNSKLSLMMILKMFFYFKFHKVRLSFLRNRFSFLNEDFINSVDWDYINELNSKSIFITQKNDITRFNLPALLRYEDKNSMKFAIETRLPYLDYRIVEFALNTGISNKINGGWTKFLLRKIASKYIPKSIAWRKNKVGFEAPLNHWFSDRTELLNEIHESSLLKKFAKNIPNDIKDHNLFWKLYNIARWEKLFNVKGVV